MSVRKTTNNYQDRLIDLEFLQTITEPVSTQAVTISLVKPVSKIVTGMQKLVQRYLNLFLTVWGDLPFAPELGTNFIPALLRGNLTNFGRLIDVFALANTATLAELAATTEDLPADEIIKTAELEDFDINVSDGTIRLTIKITNQANDEVEYVIPSLQVGER